MANVTIFFLLLISLLFAAGALAFFCVRDRLQIRNMRRRLRLTERRLGQYRYRLVVLRGRVAGASGRGPRVVDPEVEEAPTSGLRLRLQKGQTNSSGIVERYRLVGNMVRRGLSAEDISAILQLPQSETEQLLKLAQVGRANE